MKKTFYFSKPLMVKGVRDLRLQFIHKGDLVIKGTGELIQGREDETDGSIKYNVDFDSIEWNGANVLDLLEISDVKGCSLLDEVYDATYANLDYLFSKDIKAA